jgi:ketosteroid isomerase-like protein
MKADQQTEKEVLAALQRLTEAVRNKDVKSTLEMFAQEEGVVFVGSEAGETARGMEQLRACFEQVFEGPIGFDFRWEECDVNVVGEVAWLFTDGHIKTSSAAGRHEHPFRVTGVLRRVGPEWLWMHFHGSVPAG